MPGVTSSHCDRHLWLQGYLSAVGYTELNCVLPYPQFMSTQTLLGNKDVCRCNQIKMSSYWIRVCPNLMTGTLVRGKFGCRNTWGEHHVMMETDWSDAAVNQGTVRLPAPTWSEEESRKDSSLNPLEGSWPCCSLDFRLLASRTWDNKFPLFLAVRLGYFVLTAAGNSYGVVSSGRCSPSSAMTWTAAPRLLLSWSSSLTLGWPWAEAVPTEVKANVSLAC